MGYPPAVMSARPSSSIRVLHIADLQLGARSEAEVAQVVAEFLESRARWPAEFEHVDLVVISGDVTNTGSKAEFERASRVLERVLAAVPGARVVAVPGNHDVRRPDDDAAVAYMPFDAYDEGEASRHVKTLRRQLWENRQPTLVQRLFREYAAWFREFVRPRLSGPGVTLHESFFPGDLRVDLALPGKPPLALVGLNSAWRGYQDEQRGRLTVDPEQLLHASPREADGHPKPLPASALLVMHHPPDWLSLVAQRHFESHIYAPTRFLACLHGHAPGQPPLEQARGGGRARVYLPTRPLLGRPREASAAPEFGAQADSLGYVLGELASDGALRVWPYCRVRKLDGVFAFDRDELAHWSERGVLVRPPRPVSATPQVEVAEPQAVRTYRAWLSRREAKVDLVGVAGGEMQLDLEAIYVALRVAPHEREEMPGSDGERRVRGRDVHGIDNRGAPSVDPGAGGGEPEAARSGATRNREALRGGQARRPGPHLAGDAEACIAPRGEDRDFGVDEVFSNISTRHALVLGHPGSGKTTALQKLLHQVAREGPEALGLAPGTVPVFLPLRRFAETRQMRNWLGEELAGQAPKDPLPPELGAALWDHRRLLVLADGLDEVAHEPERIALCGYLQRHLLPVKQVRAIVSSRYAGYRGRVGLSADFTALDLRPLGERQVEELVTRWFHEAPKSMPSVPPAEAQARGARLVEALKGPLFVHQRRAVMKGTPLLLTLLCVIVNSGKEIPEGRVAFYQQCLDVMLTRWGKTARESPPLDLATMTLLIQHLAYALHSAGERDDLPRAKLVQEVMGRLRALGQNPRQASAAIEWLYRHAGILREFATDHLGFFHLGVQEYLAAVAIGADPRTRLAPLVAVLDTSWWHEVSRVLVALPGGGMFGLLVERLLELDRAWPRHLDLLHRWIDESTGATAAPLVTHARKELPEQELLATLGLLDRFVGDPEVLAVARGLVGCHADEVRLAAQRLCARHEEQERARAAGVEVKSGPSHDRPVALVFTAAQRIRAEGLARQLVQRGRRIWRLVEGLPDATALSREWLNVLPTEAAVVVVMADEYGPAFSGDEEVAAALAVWEGHGLPRIGAWFGGAAPAWPSAPDETTATAAEWIACRGEVGPLSVAILRALGAEDPALVCIRGQAFTDPMTGIRFLWVPGGRFQMGQRGVPWAEPVHWVRLSPYWLAETPTTNAQYERFLHANPNYPRPPFWQDERFAGDTRPVVGVSWEDVVTFCAWMSGRFQTRGVKVLLPSEARWEFAARGADGRTYPWGSENPDASRAVFRRKKSPENTASVGNRPQGKGPFGHLDLIGSVWEWCLDVWSQTAYAGRKNDALDPVCLVSREKWRPVRGGSWYGEALAAAERFSFLSIERCAEQGFRVAAEPADPRSPWPSCHVDGACGPG